MLANTRATGFLASMACCGVAIGGSDKMSSGSGLPFAVVPNVHAMSQFAAGAAVTTKPYVSGSAYLRRMSDHGPGEWREDWDALYWTFVEDHREVFEANPRSRMVTRSWDAMDAVRREALTGRGRAVIERL